MATLLESSIVRFRAANGTSIGVGFLVAEQQVLTCAHVITRGLGLPDDVLEAPVQPIEIDFPLLAPDHLLVARVKLWCPVKLDGSGDIAVLEIEHPVPQGASPVGLVNTEDLWGHSFRAFGFPLGQGEGVWASGVLRSRQAAGWVQLEDVKVAGYRIEAGFSGSPIWDEQANGVVGMAVAAEVRPETKVAFIIPVDVLVAGLPSLGQYVVSPKTTETSALTSSIAPLLSIPSAGLFVGRAVLLNELMQMVDQHRLLIVQGLAGVGKSSLVARVAQNIRPQYKDVAWIKCKDNTNFDYIALMVGAFLAQLGKPEILDTTLSSTKITPVEKLAALLLRELQDEKLLLVFDDFDKTLNRNGYIADSRLQLLLEILSNTTHRSNIIITSRFAPRLPRKLLGYYGTAKVEGLSESESIDLLNAVGEFSAQNDILSKVYRAVRGHPFALKIFASLTEFYPLKTLLADSRLFLDECGTNLLDKLFQTIQPNEVEWTKRLSVLRGYFPLEVILGLGGEVAVVELLQRRFLLSFDNALTTYNMHPLIREFVYDRTASQVRMRYHADVANYYSLKLSRERIGSLNFEYAVEASYHYSRAGDLSHTIDLPISFTESLHYLGLLFFKQKDYIKAEKCYSAILRLDDQDDKAHFYLAASTDLQGPAKRSQSKAAIEQHYLRALKTRPQNAQYLDYYAYFLMNLGRLQEAREYFEQGVQVSATCPTLYKRYGVLLRELGEIGRAEDIFERGCKIAYNNGQVFVEYAKLKATLGQTSLAIEIAQKGLKKNPNYQPLKDVIRALERKT